MMRQTRQLAKWSADLDRTGWAVEYWEGGLLKSNPDGGREGRGGLAICEPGIVIGFSGAFALRQRKVVWSDVQSFDGSDDSLRVVSFWIGPNLGAITFMSDRHWRPDVGAPYRGPRNEITDNVRPHLPSDGWDSFRWSAHKVTKTVEQLADFVLSFLSTSTRPVEDWQVVLSLDVATRCVEVLGQTDANGLLEALSLSLAEDRLAAIDALPSVRESSLLLVWFHTLAGVVEEGLDYDPTALSELRGQMISSLQGVLGT